ncbi:MAG: DUF499 domain-containing protein [Acidimicrobiaceae bacterium]|nr:DUF499 domain-containing protein [Acidimicrobiaceae bacterium]
MPDEPCAVATVVGDCLDPINGLHDPATGTTTFTFWGEIARQLSPETWQRFERSDSSRTAPGKQMWLDAFATKPTLIVVDELALHLAQLASSADADVRRQEQATVQALKVLFEAATAAPAVRLIFTLATGTSAFSEQTDKLEQAISSVSIEGASSAAHDVMARSKGAVGRPAHEHEIGCILQRRLFESIDEKAAEAARGAYTDAYAQLAERDPDSLGAATADPAGYGEKIRSCYPFHPALIDCLDKRIGPLPGFQRARGALKMLAESLAVLHSDASASGDPLAVVNLGDLPLSTPAVRACITGGINRPELDPPAQADFAGAGSHAALIDDKQWPRSRLARRACTTVFCHSVATDAAGAAASDVNLGTLRPGEQPPMIDEALSATLAAAWHLHSDGGRWRIRVEPNANKIVAAEAANVSNAGITEEIEAKLRKLFVSSGAAKVVHFPAGPADVDDTAQLQLVVVSHSDAAADPAAGEPPDLLERIAERAGAAESVRTFRNALVFVVAGSGDFDSDDDIPGAGDNARAKVRLELAARRVCETERLSDFSDEVVKQIKALAQRTELDTRMALCRAYRHVWWPQRVSGGRIDLKAMELPPSDQGKTGGAQTERVLKLMRDYAKVTDAAPATDVLARCSGFDRSGEITTEDLAQTPWRAPEQALVLDQALLVKAIEAGVRNGAWVCHDTASDAVLTARRTGSVRIAADVMLYSKQRAAELGLLQQESPEPPPKPPKLPEDDPEVSALSVKGSTGVALEKLGDALSDAAASTLSSIGVTAAAGIGEGVQPLLVLGLCVSQLARFSSKLKLEAAAEFARASGSVEVRLEGDADACTAAFDSLCSMLELASDVSGSLTLTLTRPEGIDVGGTDYQQFCAVLRGSALGHVAITAQPADAR